MAYTDSTQVSNYLQRALTQYETDQLPTIIAAIKKWLDATLGSTFDVVTPTTRFYDGGLANLSIDPCTAITEVKSISDDGSSSYTYDPSYEYVAYPQNQNVKNELRKRLRPFPRGISRVGVTAMFSEYDGGVPADIQVVAQHLAAALINQGKQANVAGGTVKSESLEGHSITYLTASDMTNGASLDSLASSDPTVASILTSRRDMAIDDYEPRDTRVDYDEDDGGLLI